MLLELPPNLRPAFKDLQLPKSNSHKGQNGKLMIIGGSELFHAASKWSLDVASHFVDMVFYTSVPANNALVREAKSRFWNGIVVPREHLLSYLDEADVILIGPGMTRDDNESRTISDIPDRPESVDWNGSSWEVVNFLLKKYPKKRWVIDAGALQMVMPELLTPTTIITPHYQELQRLQRKLPHKTPKDMTASEQLQGSLCVLKGQVDVISHGKKTWRITGGNPGLTKGGTGDVLAGLIAALYCTNAAATAALVGSYTNKKASEVLATNMGPFFNASELVSAIPETLWELVKKAKKIS